MRKTALALFKNQDQVDWAFRELIESGFPQMDLRSFNQIGDRRDSFHIATIGDNEDDRYGDQKSELFKSLRLWGVPWEDAALFTEGVRHGGKLAVVFARDEDADLVIKALKKHGALDLDTRKRFVQEARMRPSEGDTSSPFTKIVKQSHFHHDFTAWLCENRDTTGPRDPVKFYEVRPAPEDLGLEHNLNE